ncbi:bifunctional 4-hydroxy-2-oxoglutarate aldolase/2-dehydro-3-deoxy-phosphogluconate aldolase [Cupriavidus taiwanensis]|uniref:bifunctional 4-hydroxy-2-oxoglutarate aldolase/2-dehydro-3-deoxy-phosphogluconate aldolase n=1 Tax=Cupriavidus taiwanensis TaxID=164546 RepID=UPI000E10E5F3|nr:bifunctional 4-hydroxy-2-oxoglutarate aldolase/2-dehydro-3-deoxy-phosphogluconate aldolase [Cupriavidus taiwanensis]SOY61535.1 multifunctional: 2-keto-3-deoxygluconate 6-phosphate aldolase; 2-keto-4-hydroxyglutarate aldolase; oxaloacetate decarboxylase [Cupriavidus taiwanensis]SOY62593.1 multifunctional: 2-keto-3-deoxygluconate 6-phosphate aldolase; 2-keto-4-hydroxyglutarate aldolase; oxaloacetate decarboxylase [Cupriavidus taiwanensis]SOY98029.1 multifunctional: 2-keto-3-deoxygluconate 6-pho
MSNQTSPLLQRLADVPVIPVLEFHSVDEALHVSEALVTGGLPLLEITLRTPVALEAIRAVAAALPQACVGAGTVLNVEQLHAVRDAGAQFAVSPGLTPTLAAGAQDAGISLLPGVATASEAMAALEAGFTFLKFFPAQAAGGVPMLKSLGGPLPQLRFCPTGGIDAALAPSYLALPNVVCVGGSWVVPKDAVAGADWGRIRALAEQARALRARS